MWYNLHKVEELGEIFMDDRCIFCGTELGILQKKKLYCGNTTQILCKDCYPKYKPLSAIERAEAALKTGRADRISELNNYLNTVNEARRKNAEERRAKNEERVTDLKCLRCAGRMVDYGPVTFKLGEETYFLIRVPLGFRSSLMITAAFSSKRT